MRDAQKVWTPHYLLLRNLLARLIHLLCRSTDLIEFGRLDYYDKKEVNIVDYNASDHGQSWPAGIFASKMCGIIYAECSEMTCCNIQAGTELAEVRFSKIFFCSVVLLLMQIVNNWGMRV